MLIIFLAVLIDEINNFNISLQSLIKLSNNFSSIKSVSFKILIQYSVSFVSFNAILSL